MDRFKFICFFILLVHVTKSAACKGCVELDDFSFNKLIKVFPTVLVKFDIAFPYGEKHETYEQFSKELSKSQDLLVAQVGVKDYGDRDNENIANRYKIKKEDYPVLLLFKNGNLDEPVKFSDEYTLDNIKRFVKMNSQIYLGAPGCLESYDKLAINFLNDKDNRLAIKADAEILLEEQSSENKQFANTYITIMDKIIKNGEVFVGNEQKRLKKLLRERLSQNKELQLKQKLNILDSFSKSIKKEEL